MCQSFAAVLNICCISYVCMRVCMCVWIWFVLFCCCCYYDRCGWRILKCSHNFAFMAKCIASVLEIKTILINIVLISNPDGIGDSNNFTIKHIPFNDIQSRHPKHIQSTATHDECIWNRWVIAYDSIRSMLSCGKHVDAKIPKSTQVVAIKCNRLCDFAGF